MAENSKIEWTHHTANLWWGCTKVHEGCDNCYAETLSNRWGNEIWGSSNPRKQIKSWRTNIEKWQKEAAAKNEIHRVFVGSMMDIFEKPMPLIDHNGHKLKYQTDRLRNILFDVVIPQSPNLLFLLLTKRPSNINKYIPVKWKTNPPKNVMFGTSVVNQKTANTAIRQLSMVSGKKFISCEPMLDKVDLFENSTEWQLLIDHVDWVILGGESGHKRRPFNPDWARTIRDQCKEEKVAFFMKQWDKVKEIPEDLMIREFPKIT